MVERLPTSGAGLLAKVNELIDMVNATAFLAKQTDDVMVAHIEEAYNGSPMTEPNTTGYVDPATLANPMRQYIGAPVLFEDDDIHNQPGTLAAITDQGYIDGAGHVWQVCKPAPPEGIIPDTDPRYGLYTHEVSAEDMDADVVSVPPKPKDRDRYKARWEKLKHLIDVGNSMTDNATQLLVTGAILRWMTEFEGEES